MTRGARSQAKLREHYRRFRTKISDGTWYNFVLDDAKHPDNPRGWVHGMVEGNSQAGCGCPRCLEAGRQENQRKQEVRLAKRLAGHKARAAEILAKTLPEVPAQTIAAGVDTLVSTHTVRSRFHGTVTYELTPVMLALQNWSLTTGVALADDTRAALANRLIKELI